MARFAMEQLINKVLTRGTGKKANLEIKVFGGGKINGALDDIGMKNIEFVREFLANEGYPLSQGRSRRRLCAAGDVQTSSGRAFIKRLDNTANASIAREELAVAASRRNVVTQAGCRRYRAVLSRSALARRPLPRTRRASIDLINHSGSRVAATGLGRPAGAR